MKNKEEKNKILHEKDKKENNSPTNDNNINPSMDTILNKLFLLSKENSQRLPLLKKNNGSELKDIFNKHPENTDLSSLKTFINDKINIINEIRKLIGNKYEIIHIINNYLIKYDIFLFKYYIDLYLCLLFMENKDKNKIIVEDKSFNIIQNLQEIFVYFINCGLLNKDITDYVFQNISAMQLEQKLNIKLFNIYIPLLEILYGKNNYGLKSEYIAKNYIYLFNKNTSIIKTNISPLNQIKISKGLCIIVWFYLYEFCNEKEKPKGTICQILTNDLQKIDIILNKDFDLDVKYNTKELLKEKKGNKFNIKCNIWTQLKIQFIDNKIQLFLCQNNDSNSEFKYEIKTYLINYEKKNKTNAHKKNNNNKFNKLKCNNFDISYLNFFMGYEGLVGTILFYNNANYDKINKKIGINSISGLDNNKINNFIKKINLKDFYFIIAPSLYCIEENKFMDTTNNINAELSIETNENNLNLNSVVNIYNYTKNIFYLGGCNNLLPLFEIIYNFSHEIDKNHKNNENKKIYDNDILNISKTLVNLFKLLEIVFINNKRNCMEAYKNSIHFFESLQLFLENIDKKYFNCNDYFKSDKIGKEKEIENCIISSLLNMGKYFYEIKNKKIMEAKERHGYFMNILFYPSIIMKFNLFQQNEIFSFFDIIKKENSFFKGNEYKCYFIPWDKILKLLILFSEKYKDTVIPSHLFNIIKIIFEDFTTTDSEREDLFLLYHKHLVSDKVFISIMEIFIIYFDVNTNNELLDNETIRNNSQDKDSETIINLRNNSIKYFLYSSNLFIENLLNILLSKNLYIKKLIINFLRILTNKYNSFFEEYFSYVNEGNKTHKNNKRINKKDFFFFIKENIIINEFNEKIIAEFELNKDKGKINKKKKRKTSIEEDNNYKIKLEDEDLNINKRRKSIDIQLGKNQRKKIMSILTKKKKKRRSIANISNLPDNNSNSKKRSNSLKLKEYQNKYNNDEIDIVNIKDLHLKKGKIIFKKRNKSCFDLGAYLDEEYEMNIIETKDNDYIYNDSSNIILDLKEKSQQKLNNLNISENKENMFNKKNRSLTVIKPIKKVGNEPSIKKKRHRNRKRGGKKQNKNNNVINEFNENETELDSNKNEGININCDISMILYDWLISIKYKKRESTNSSSNTLELIDKILIYVVKFLSHSTQLEVIYRTLFIILGQKNLENNINKKYKTNYNKLLSYFSNSAVFKQLLEEILIDSYLGYNNDKTIMNQYDCNENSKKLKDKSTKKNLFEKIYNITKELLIDIYLYKSNQTRNYIIYDLYNIILKKYNGLQKKYNESTFKLFSLLKNFFIDIINKYHELLDHNDNINNINNINIFSSLNSNNSVNINDNIRDESKYIKVYKNYIEFFTLFFEFSFVFKNYKRFISISKKNTKPEVYLSFSFPNFIKDGMIFGSNSKTNKLEDWLIYDQYKFIINDLKEIYSLKNIFKELKLCTDDLEEEDQILHLDIEVIGQLINEIVFKKELRGKYKEKIELLLSNYKQSGYFNNFPLINILTLYKCVLLNYDNNIDNRTLIQLLNDIQVYTIFIILISCNIKKDDFISNESLNYDDIQEIIFQNLLFLMRNIIYKYTKNFETKEENKNIINTNNNEINTNNFINDEVNDDIFDSSDYSEDENDGYYIIILNNIFSILSSIYTKNNDNINKSNSFLWKKSKINNDINFTGVNKLLDYYMKIYGTLFNNDNLLLFSKNNNQDSNTLIIQQKRNLYNYLVKNKNSFKFRDKSSSELFHYKLFKSICLGRENEIKKKLKLLLKTNQENNKHKSKKAVNMKYKNLLININFLQLNYDNNNDVLIEEKRDEIFKIKNYRKIKKNLYSFNNSFSNLDVFYKKNKKYYLPYKISNYLSNDKTRKLIMPILDFDYYLPNFRKFTAIDGKMFKKDISNKLYKINLRILDNPRIIAAPEINNNSYYLYNDICLIKTTHHIRGKLFFKTEKENLKKTDNCYLYFTVEKNITKEYLLENCPDYDSVNGTCFGSTFRNNLNQKDDEVYIRIKFSEINFIFFRKYSYRNNSIEIFSNNHKSYYFKFKNTNSRDNFIEKFINILNHKKLFKKIKSIDEHNKSIVLGYYKDIDNNKDYKTINDIKDLWKNNKISTLEYIMWINMYGNRSFRDAAQYPVLPWILNDYNLNKVENIINLNALRNFNLPMGMMSLDERGNSRKEGYIEGYKLMVNEISQDINVKKPNEIEDDEEEDSKLSLQTKTSIDELKDSDEDTVSNKSKNLNNEKENKLKIPDYKYDLDKLYYNLNIEYERIPYFFGTHYSNPMYVCHYLTRLFPYSFLMIEIQGDGFDCPDRLFYNLKNTFFSSTHEKCDLRELIPEFFTLPEMFININNFNLGEIEDNFYISNMKPDLIEENKENKENKENNEDNIINTDSNSSSINIKTMQINNVALPPWTKQDPYYFIQITREIFEGGIELNKKNKFININPWLDLIFGYYQRGIKAQNKGNLFIPASYDGVIDFRIKEENILKNREENEFRLRFFEIGVTPTKVFEKKCKETKKEINYQITSLKNNNEVFNLSKKDCVKLITKNKIIYFNCNFLENNKLFLIDNNFEGHNIIIQKDNEDSDTSPGHNDYSINNIQTIRDFPLVELKRKNIGYKIIIKSIFKGLLIIITGYYDGSLYLINTSTTKKTNKRNGYNVSSELNTKENNTLQTFGNKLITSLEISKDEKYMICGNEVGSLIIYSLNYSLFVENKKYIELLKIIKSHNNKINSISINNNMFLFAGCSYDGYINLYTYPKLTLINSIYINDTKMKKNEIDFVFLSSQPLPVIVLYSNKNCLFKTYSINGKDLNYESNDKTLLKQIEIPFYNNNNMIDPFIFTDYKFNDYLAYIFKYKFIIIRKFPEMKIHLKIDCLNKNYSLTKLIISNDLKYLYAYEENENNIYIVHNNIYKKETKKIEL